VRGKKRRRPVGSGKKAATPERRGHPAGKVAKAPRARGRHLKTSPVPGVRLERGLTGFQVTNYAPEDARIIGDLVPEQF